MRLIGWSSTTSTSRPSRTAASTGGGSAREGAGSAAAGGAATAFVSATGSGSVTRTSVPSPRRLRSSIVPPMRRVSCRLIESPRPVPPKRLVVSALACVNASKTRSCSSAVMPMPVSRTSRRSTFSFGRDSTSRTRMETSPRGVNLIALFTRFPITCCRRTGSKRRAGAIPASTFAFNARPLRLAIPE